MTEERPPRGLMPRHIFDEKCNCQRVVEITEAMQRYCDVKKPVPAAWFDELRERVGVDNGTAPPYPYPSHRSWTT